MVCKAYKNQTFRRALLRLTLHANSSQNNVAQSLKSDCVHAFPQAHNIHTRRARALHQCHEDQLASYFFPKKYYSYHTKHKKILVLEPNLHPVKEKPLTCFYQVSCRFETVCNISLTFMEISKNSQIFCHFALVRKLWLFDIPFATVCISYFI